MNDHNSATDPSRAFLEIARKFYPRCRLAPRGVRSYSDACEWARTLDWRNNPYDRFLLRRELLLHVEREMHEDPRRSVLRFATYDEVQSEIDRLLVEFPATCERLGEDFEQTIGVFAHIMLLLPWRLGHKHGLVRYSHLTKALRSLRK